MHELDEVNKYKDLITPLVDDCRDSNMRWTTPHTDWIKLNCDGAVTQCETKTKL